MTLIRKALLKTALTTALLVLALYVLARYSLMSSIQELEYNTALQNGNRALAALNRDIDELSIIVGDWAQWDDTYNYVTSPNETYINSNMGDSSFDINHLNVIVIMDASGKTIYSKGYSWRDRRSEKVPGEILGYFVHEIQSSGLQETKGILNTQGRPYMIAAKPIITSNGEAGPNGLLIMGRSLEGGEIDIIARQTDLRVSLQTAQGENPPFEESADRPVSVRPLDDKIIRAYAPLADLNHKQALYLQVDMPRDIYNQGYSGMMMFITGLILIAVAFCLLLISFLDRDIISRITTLADRVGVIGRLRDISARVELEGEDELTVLAEDINSMLDRLEEITVSRQKSNRIVVEKDNQLQFLLDSMDQGFLAFGPNRLVYPETSAACVRLLGTDPNGKDFCDLIENVGEDAIAFCQENMELALQTQNPDKAGFYYEKLPAQIFTNDKVLALHYRLAPEFKLDDGYSTTVFLTDTTSKYHLQKQLNTELARLEMLRKVKGSIADFSDLVNNYIDFYSNELAADLERLDKTSSPGKAKQLVQKVSSYAGKFRDFGAIDTAGSLDQLASSLLAMLDQDAIDEQTLREIASPACLENLLQSDLIWLERFLGDDFLTDPAW